MGRVRLTRTLLIAAAVEGVGLAAAGLTSYFVGLTSGGLQWALPTVFALVAAMGKALVEATFTEWSEQPRPGGHAGPGRDGGRSAARRGTPAFAAILVVLVVVGGGGLALSAAVRYGYGYLTGREPGVDRLVQPAPSGSSGPLTLTVEHVLHTAHFTRVDLAVQNAGDSTVDLPLFGYCILSSADGTTLQADSSRSDWSTTVPPGAFQRGVVTFDGHLPAAAVQASLSFSQVFGPGNFGALTVQDIMLGPAL